MKNLQEFVRQFVLMGEYREKVFTRYGIDLINLSICKVQDNNYVSQERASFDGVTNFLMQNGLWDVFYDSFISIETSLNFSARGFLTEHVLLMSLHLLQKKNLPLISIIPDSEQCKLSINAHSWLNSSYFCPSGIYKMKKKKNLSGLLNFLRIHNWNVPVQQHIRSRRTDLW
jgi:hypothetical protein